MNFIDTHAHLYVDQFSNDRELILSNAIQAGVTKIVLPNIDMESIPAMLEMQKKTPENCFACMGLHPTSVDLDYEKILTQMEDILSHERFFAIGEIGIDLYWEKKFIEQQKIVFKRQIHWALDLDIPIIIHARNSYYEVFEELKHFEKKNLKGVFHCFGSSIEDAKKAIGLGFKLGIGGVVTFPKAKLTEIVKEVSLDHIVLETDSPYLAPVPYRSKRNESAYITYIAQKIAEIKEVDIPTVANISTKNASELFKI